MSKPSDLQRNASTAAAVFAAIEAINSGQWDGWLHRLRGAIVTRTQTDEYEATLVAGEPTP